MASCILTITTNYIKVCFDNMAAAAKAKSKTFDKYIKSNAALTKTVAKCTVTNKKLTPNLSQVCNKCN